MSDVRESLIDAMRDHYGRVSCVGPDAWESRCDCGWSVCLYDEVTGDNAQFAHDAHLADVLLSLPDIQIDESNAERGTGEYLALRYAENPVEAFNLFIKHWVPPKWHAHLVDTDDNDAEFVRRHIRAASSSTTGARGADR